MKIKGWTIETCEIEIDDDVYRQAKESGRLDHELDVYLSDMDGETFVVDPNGQIYAPYEDARLSSRDVLKLLRPLLNSLPTHEIEQYAGERTYCDEVGGEPEA